MYNIQIQKYIANKKYRIMHKFADDTNLFCAAISSVENAFFK